MGGPGAATAAANALLAVEHVALGFGGLAVLNNVSLAVHPGERAAVIGPNGAGKTSLLNCINGFYHPGAGRIRYRGRDITRAAPYDIARLGVGRTFQNIELFTGATVLDNLLLARHRHIRYGLLAAAVYYGRAQAEETLHRARVEEVIDFLELEPIRHATVGGLPYGRRKRCSRGSRSAFPRAGSSPCSGRTAPGRRRPSGLLRTEAGAVRDGTISYDGSRIDGLPPEAIVRRGIVQVLEGRRVFKHLTVEENLRVGAVVSPQAFPARRDLVYTYFSPLRRHTRRLAGYLSGGEQQMIAIGRALIAQARLLLLDEPSLGLSPFLVREIFEIVRRLRDEQGITVLLVEQNAHQAVAIADYGYVMEGGKIVMEGPAGDLRSNPDIREFYLGLTESGARRDYRAFKYYRRRKRWL